MKKQQLEWLYIVLFSIVILLFNIFAKQTGFTDSAEYINVAKAIAGIINTNVFIMHSIVYSIYLAPLLRLHPSIIALRLLNALWLVLDAILLYLITKNKKALLLWLFSPIAYYMSTWISPMLPISFLFLLSYYLFKKYESTNNISYLAFSALSLGLAASLREQMLAVIAIFTLVFFFNKPFKTTLFFLLLMLPTFAIRLLVDYYYFKLPFYTLITFAGSLVLGGTEGGSFILSEWYFFPFIIAPLAFLVYKLNWKEYKREFIFLMIFVLTTVPLGQLRFFMPIAPMVILLLSKVISQKQLLINILISIVIISVVSYPLFMRDTEEQRVIQDLNSIKSEINPAVAVVTNGGAYSFPALPTNYWHEKGPRYIWSRDLELFLADNPKYREIKLESKPRLDADKIISVEFSSRSNTDSLLTEDFLSVNPYFILNKKEFKYYGNKLTILWRGELDIDNVSLVKCYQELCVFRRM